MYFKIKIYKKIVKFKYENNTQQFSSTHMICFYESEPKKQAHIRKPQGQSNKSWNGKFRSKVEINKLRLNIEVKLSKLKVELSHLDPSHRVEESIWATSSRSLAKSIGSKNQVELDQTKNRVKSNWVENQVKLI